VDEDEIDLRQYLDVLIRWWREIVVITVGVAALAAIVILLLRWLLPPAYEASADVAIVRTVSEVQFDERFRTTSAESTPDTASVSARRSALLGLVATGAIAQQVIAQVGDQLTPEEQNPANLLEMVEASTASVAGARGDSDLIRITVTADKAEKAAAIANAWARAYVQAVNTIYGQVPDEVLTSIQTELDTAQQTYKTNQANLETFLASNQIDALSSRVTMLQQRVNQEVTLQQGLLQQWQAAQQQLNTARALRLQAEQGGEAAARSNMAALQVLKMSVYSLPPERLTVEVRDVPQVTSAGMIADLEGLIVSLEGQLQTLETQIAALSTQSEGAVAAQGSISGTTPSLLQIFAELRTLKSQLEAETARQLQLTQQRDLSWETYKTVNSKVAELNLARAAASSEVRFGAPAVAPVEAVKRFGLILGTVGAGLVGLFVAVFYTFLANYLGRAPFLTFTGAKAVQ
jgi:uncharacterized protein involved in exopolysaccharide biosynthesis